MQRSTDHNANGVIQGAVRKVSSSRKFHESRKIEPTDNPRMANRSKNGNAKHDMLNGQAKKASSTSLDPNTFFEAATLLGSVGSLNAAETTDRVRRGSTSCEEDCYKGYAFPFENLVFEGGGNKGMAYVGALQVFLIYLLDFFTLCCCALCFDSTNRGHGFLRCCVLSNTGQGFFSLIKLSLLSCRFRGCFYSDIIFSLCLSGTSFPQSKLVHLLVIVNSFA